MADVIMGTRIMECWEERLARASHALQVAVTARCDVTEYEAVARRIGYLEASRKMFTFTFDALRECSRPFYSGNM